MTAPPPLSISPAGQAYLTRKRSGAPPLDPADLAGWAAYRTTVDAADEARLRDAVAGFPVAVRPIAGPDFQAFDAMPEDLQAPAQGKLVVYFHGGGMATSGGAVGAHLAKLEAYRLGCRVVSVDYRLTPENPYPAALDDCLAAYRRLLGETPAPAISFYGVSSGANLALSTCARAKQQGWRLPVSLVLVSPHIDLTSSGDSFTTNRALDVDLPHGCEHFDAMYAAEEDPRNPLVSPLFLDLAGYPAMHIQSGTRDLMLSNAVRLHQRARAANAAADLYLIEGGVHGGLGPAAPETHEARRQIRLFLSRTLGRATS